VLLVGWSKVQERIDGSGIPLLQTSCPDLATTLLPTLQPLRDQIDQQFAALSAPSPPSYTDASPTTPPPPPPPASPLTLLNQIRKFFVAYSDVQCAVEAELDSHAPAPGTDENTLPDQSTKLFTLLIERVPLEIDAMISVIVTRETTLSFLASQHTSPLPQDKSS
jgi:hypothetical protein